jgi:hypothetical protein
MFHIEMSREEIQILISLLESSIADIRGEIRDTDNREYRLMLQGREAIMKKIFSDLEESVAREEPVI